MGDDFESTDGAAPTTRRTEREGVITLCFTRPEKLNALTPEMVEAIGDAVDALATRDDLRVLVITGQGRYFTSGVDIGASMPMGEEANATNARRNGRRMHTVFDRIEAVEKPVVLAAQGPCWGAGLELAVSCDFRLAAQQSTFALPEIRLGMVPSSGGVSRLTRLVGTGWARWLAMAGRVISAEQALSMGLVHEIYPTDEFDGRVADFVDELCALPSEAVGLAKITIGVCAELGPERGRDVERLTAGIIVSTSDYRDRVKAFVERNNNKKS
ncbi:MAG: enoyl-CoA hydratase/isomerase family protein [Acidimicrobiales bacterium]